MCTLSQIPTMGIRITERYLTRSEGFVLSNQICNCGSNTSPRFRRTRRKRYLFAMGVLGMGRNYQQLTFSPSSTRRKGISGSLNLLVPNLAPPRYVVTLYVPPRIKQSPSQSDFLRTLGTGLRELRQLESARKLHAHIPAVPDESSGSDDDEYLCPKRPSKRRKTLS
jgi:hypothetical protein